MSAYNRDDVRLAQTTGKHFATPIMLGRTGLDRPALGHPGLPIGKVFESG